MTQQVAHQELEEGLTLKLDFSKINQVATCSEAVVSVVIQDARSKDVLILGYANNRALAHTLATKLATLWSTSRQELWIKGASSGDYLDVVEVRINCDQNSLLYLVTPRRSGACHTKTSDGQTRSTCFYRKLDGDTLAFL